MPVAVAAAALGLLGQGCATGQQVKISLSSARTQSATKRIDAQVITSGGYRSVPVGTAIPQTELGTRTFSDARRGVALATIKGEIFASTSKDGGRRWTVASPVLFAPAANSEMGVSQVSLKGPVTYFAWGGGGSAVDVTTDGGKRWWRAFLGGSVLSVTVNGAELAAVVQDESAHATSTVIYVSADGRHWAIAPHLAVG